MFGRTDRHYIINFLGPTQIVCDDTVYAVQDKRTTSILLLLSIKKVASRKYIAEKIWENNDAERSLANLRNHLHKVKASIGEIIRIDRTNLALKARTQTDIDFLLNDQPMPVEVALDAHRNQFLNGEDFGDYPAVDVFVKRIMEDYKSKAINTIYQELKKLKTRGDVSQSIALARRILLISPFSESAVRLLMRLYGGNGDRAAAIDIYERFRHSLRMTFGIEPEQKTRLLHRSMLLDDRFRDPPTSPDGGFSPDTII